jgi:hypothetical protein
MWIRIASKNSTVPIYRFEIRGYLTYDKSKDYML